MAAVISRRNLQIWAVGTLAGNMPGPAPSGGPGKSWPGASGCSRGAERLEPDGRSARLLEQAGESGISSYVVREPAIPHLEHVLALLAN